MNAFNPCAEVSTALVPVVHARNGVVFANSRDVAEAFGKNHQHVLRDIDQLREGMSKSGLTPSMFTGLNQTNSQNGQLYRSFEMTRDGFALVVMGYTGPKALKFKLAYITAFNDMEAQLRAPVAPALPNFSDPAAAARAWATEFEAKQPVEQKVIWFASFYWHCDCRTGISLSVLNHQMHDYRGKGEWQWTEDWRVLTNS